MKTTIAESGGGFLCFLQEPGLWLSQSGEREKVKHSDVSTGGQTHCSLLAILEFPCDLSLRFAPQISYSSDLGHHRRKDQYENNVVVHHGGGVASLTVLRHVRNIHLMGSNDLMVFRGCYHDNPTSNAEVNSNLPSFSVQCPARTDTQSPYWMLMVRGWSGTGRIMLRRAPPVLEVRQIELEIENNCWSLLVCQFSLKPWQGRRGRMRRTLTSTSSQTTARAAPSGGAGTASTSRGRWGSSVGSLSSSAPW